MAARWYVISTKLGFEHVAEANLSRQGFTTWTPRQVRVVRHARQRLEKRVPFFPGYLFVQLDVDHQRWRCVNGTFGVRSLIMQGGRPSPCPPGLVEELQVLTRGDGIFNAAAGIRPGDAVRVVSGPMAELVGALLCLDGAGRARILLKLLNSDIVVTLDAARPDAGGGIIEPRLTPPWRWQPQPIVRRFRPAEAIGSSLLGGFTPSAAAIESLLLRNMQHPAPGALSYEAGA